VFEATYGLGGFAKSGRLRPLKAPRGTE